MAVTFTASNLTRDAVGSQRRHTATITCSGTTVDNGDAFSPSTLGLAVIDQLLCGPAIDSQSNPENALIPVWLKSTGKIVFATAHGTPGGTVALIVIDDSTSVADYVFNVEGIGR